MYVTYEVQDSGKKQLNKHKSQNESIRQPPQVRIKGVFVLVLCFCSVVHCSKSETCLLIPITQWQMTSFSQTECTHCLERKCSCSVQSSGSTQSESSDYNEQSVEVM